MERHSEDDYARALVQSHRRVLRYFKRAMPHEAEDLASDVLLAAWRAIKDFRGDASVDTLTFRISSRVLSRRRRQLKRATLTELDAYDGTRERLDDELGAPSSFVDESAVAASIAVAVRMALRKLTPALARVVELSYVEGKTQREASEILGLAPGTVASRLRRAKDHLRAELAHVAQSCEKLSHTEEEGLDDGDR